MGMYAVAITPLVHQLCQFEKPDVLQVWFADDTITAGSLHGLLTKVVYVFIYLKKKRFIYFWAFMISKAGMCHGTKKQ